MSWPRTLRRLLISLAFFTALMFPAVWLATPWAYRWWHVRMIVSSDETTQQRGLNYILRNAGDERVREMALARAMTQQQDRFAAAVWTLQKAGQWRYPGVPIGAWTRWLEILASDKDPEARINAAQQIGRMTDEPIADPIVTILRKLSEDKLDDVRYNALCATAIQASLDSSDDMNARPTPRSILIEFNTNTPTLRRHALIFQGLIRANRSAVDSAKPIASQATVSFAGWFTSPDRAANLPRPTASEESASLWSLARALGAVPDRAADAVTDDMIWHDGQESTRAAAMYALLHYQHSSATAALQGALRKSLSEQSPENRLTLWRAMLCNAARATSSPATVPATSPATAPNSTDITELLRRFKEQPPANSDTSSASRTNDPMHALRCAATFVDPYFILIHDQPVDRQAMLRLARLEGLAARGDTIPSAVEGGPMIELASQRVVDVPDVEKLRELLTHEEPTLRDLACLIAARRLSAAQLSPLIQSLLKDFTDEARYSGAILSGLTGLEHDLLQKRMANQSQWNVQTIMKLGLWMQKDPSEKRMSEFAPGLLARTDLPRTTVLLAMMHRGHPGAFDYLLNASGEPTVDLMELFEHYRWWEVAGTYLPTSAPPFWVWADRELQLFQLDVLRDWYLINRHKLKTPVD